MKRILLGLFAGVMVAALPVSLQFVTINGPESVTTALVAPAYSQAATCGAGEVELSVKINPASGDCISGDPKNGGVIVEYLRQILQLLSFGIGLVILLMLVVAGIQYITANGQPASITKAKDRIKNAITALLLFAASTAILNFIIPGGILG